MSAGENFDRRSSNPALARIVAAALDREVDPQDAPMTRAEIARQVGFGVLFGIPEEIIGKAFDAVKGDLPGAQEPVVIALPRQREAAESAIAI